MAQLSPWEEYVRHLKPIMDKLDYQNGVRGLVDSLRNAISITDGELIILLRILRTDPSDWSVEQIAFIKNSNLDSIISTILDEMNKETHKNSFSPSEFSIYIKSIIRELEDKENGY